jgi:hypothetical protein
MRGTRRCKRISPVKRKTAVSHRIGEVHPAWHGRTLFNGLLDASDKNHGPRRLRDAAGRLEGYGKFIEALVLRQLR